MAQWQRLLMLDLGLQGQVSQLYERRFPREIRHYLCVQIESQDWDAAAADETKACACFDALLEYMDEQWNRSVQQKSILQGPDYPGMSEYLRRNFQNAPLTLANILSECLKEEYKILTSASETQGSGSPNMDQKWIELENKVKELKGQTQELKEEIRSLEALNEKLDFIQNTWQSQVEQHIGNARSQVVVERECLKQESFIMQTKQVVLQQVLRILKNAEQIVATLTDVELPEWKHRQQMACIGSSVDTCLDYLQKWFTTVAEVLLQAKEQLHILQDQNKKYNSTDATALRDPIAEMEQFTLSLLTKLLTNALVVEKQPVMASQPQRPLILKTGVRFTVIVRFLAHVQEFKRLIKVQPVFDKDVEEVKTIKGFRQFDFVKDDHKVLDENTPSGGLVAEFGHMSLKEKKARTKGSHESPLIVTEELHVIKFVTELRHAGLECNIEATSLPVVVVSSTNQVPCAWASIMWCNMLSTSEPMSVYRAMVDGGWFSLSVSCQGAIANRLHFKNLSFFIDPPPLTWQQLSQVLSWQFLSIAQRGLDENQLLMLHDKFVDGPDDLVHWSKFSKNEGPWIWIDGILDLIKKHLVDLWRDGSIMGFVSRERTRALLQEKQSGTFLIRFSESVRDGAITFSWVEHSIGEMRVSAVEPYSKQELSAISLPDIIQNYSLRNETTTWNPLLYLYPDIHKDTAFGRYYKTSDMAACKKTVNGYIHTKLIPFSVNPTPPPSPPREVETMDLDLNASEILRELFSDLLD